MPTSIPSYDEIVAASQDFIQTRTGLNNFAEGSVIESIIELHAQKVSDIYTLLSQAESARDIELATGQDLDNLARSLGGLTRNPATTAGASSSVAQLLVTNTSNSNLTFNSNTAVWSSTNPNTRFYSTTSVNIPAQTSAAVFVQAAQTGVSYNIAPGQLDSSNASSSFTVSNFLPVQGGSDVESDDDFRYRISQTLRSAILGGQSSAAGMTLALKAIPGVSDIILLPESRGPGTVDAMIVTANGYNPDDDFITSCTETMAGVAAVGVSVSAIVPTVIPVATEVSISATGQSANLSPQGPLISIIQTVVQNYINSRTVQVNPVSGVVNPYNIGGNSNTSYINYTLLLNNITNAAISLLGNSIQNVVLSFTVGSATDQAFQTDIYARNGEVLRSSIVNVLVNYS